MPPSTIPAPSFSHLQPFKTKGKRSWRNKGSRLLAKKKKKEATAAKVAKNKRSKEKRRSQSQEQSEGAKKWAGEENWQEMLIFFFFFCCIHFCIYCATLGHYNVILLVMFPLASQAQAMTRTKGKVGGGVGKCGWWNCGAEGAAATMADWLTAKRHPHTHIQLENPNAHKQSEKSSLIFIAKTGGKCGWWWESWHECNLFLWATHTHTYPNTDTASLPVASS